MLRPTSQVLNAALDHVTRCDCMAVGGDVSSAADGRSPLCCLTIFGLAIGAIMIEERPHVEHAIKIRDAVGAKRVEHGHRVSDVALCRDVLNACKCARRLYQSFLVEINADGNQRMGVQHLPAPCPIAHHFIQPAEQ